MEFKISVIILGVFCLTSFSLGQNLTVVPAKNRLPLHMFGMSVFYDGVSDFIYLLGGISEEEGVLDYILRFDISTEVVEHIATMPNSGYRSPVVEDSDGNIVYINGELFFPEVFKLNITDHTVTNAGVVQFSSAWAASAKNATGNALIFGGIVHEEKIWELNFESESLQSQVVGDISESYSYSVSAERGNNTALVFGVPGRVPCILLDLDTLESRNATPSGFPGFRSGMTVTRDDDFVYLFGGNFSSTPANGIIRMGIGTNTWDFILVEDFPVQDGLVYYDAPEVVWVEKQNRIYMFGGHTLNDNGTDAILDDIWYIDLSQLDRPTALKTQ